MNMFNQEPSYLKASDYNTVVATCVLTGSVLIFESARDAERVSGGKFHNYGIGQSIKGAYSCHRGYVWSLLEGEYNV